MRKSWMVHGVVFVVACVTCLGACGGGTSKGGAGGGGAGAVGAGGATGLGGAAGALGLAGTTGAAGVGGATGVGGSVSAGSGGHAGASMGAGGSTVAGSGGGNPTGGSAGAGTCSPCLLSLASFAVACTHSSGATCVEQVTNTTGADGTATRVQNTCYSDGAKELDTETTPPPDGGAANARTEAIQVFKGGTLCATVEAVESEITTDSSGARMQTVTETIKDGTGNLVATEVISAVRDPDAGEVDTWTITCPGQPAEQFDPNANCLPSSSVTCTDGTCM